MIQSYVQYGSYGIVSIYRYPAGREAEQSRYVIMNIEIGLLEPSLRSRLTRTWFGIYPDTKAHDDCIVSLTSIDIPRRKSPNPRFDPVVFDHWLHFYMVYLRAVASHLVGYSSIKSRMLKVSALDRLAPKDTLLLMALVRDLYSLSLRELCLTTSSWESSPTQSSIFAHGLGGFY